MDETKAREILGDTIDSDGKLNQLSPYVFWATDDSEITLDGFFSEEYLEAILWWMRNKHA